MDKSREATVEEPVEVTFDDESLLVTVIGQGEDKFEIRDSSVTSVLLFKILRELEILNSK